MNMHYSSNEGIYENVLILNNILGEETSVSSFDLDEIMLSINNHIINNKAHPIDICKQGLSWDSYSFEKFKSLLSDPSQPYGCLILNRTFRDYVITTGDNSMGYNNFLEKSFYCFPKEFRTFSLINFYFFNLFEGDEVLEFVKNFDINSSKNIKLNYKKFMSKFDKKYKKIFKIEDFIYCLKNPRIGISYEK